MQKRREKWKNILTERELRGIESGNKSRKSLIWCLLYLWKKKFIMMCWLGSGLSTTRLLICGLDTNNKIYCKSCLWRVLGTLLSTRKLLIKISISLTKGRRIFFLTMLFIKKLRFFKKSTIGINFIQIKYPHLRRLESLRNSCDWPTNFQNFWAKWG